MERKIIPDFISSIADGRLFRQVSELAGNCKNPLLLPEGGGLHRLPRMGRERVKSIRQIFPLQNKNIVWPRNSTFYSSGNKYLMLGKVWFVE